MNWMKCLVNWNLMRICIRSRNTQPHLNCTLRTRPRTNYYHQGIYEPCNGPFSSRPPFNWPGRFMIGDAWLAIHAAVIKRFMIEPRRWFMNKPLRLPYLSVRWCMVYYDVWCTIMYSLLSCIVYYDVWLPEGGGTWLHVECVCIYNVIACDYM